MQPGLGDIRAGAIAIGTKILAAETAKDVDPLIADLAALKAGMRLHDEDPDGQISEVARSVDEFARRWQDFLAARAAGNVERVRSVLAEMLVYGREFPGIPRSEILARAYGAPPKSGDGKNPVEAAALLPTPEQILAKIKTLDDLDRFVPEFTAAVAPERATWLAMVNEFQSIARTYRDLRAGNSARVSLGLSGNESREPITSLRSQLALFALPRAIGASEADQPQPDETVLTYMRRMIAVARERKDWPFASRVLAAAQNTQVNDPLLKPSDSTGLTSFFAGLNFERGRQYSLAVNSFQMALKTGSDLVPAEDIGERLEAIKRDHATDYEAGLKMTLSSPVPVTDPDSRPTRDPRYPVGFPGNPFGPNGPGGPAKEQPVIVPAVKEPAAKSAAPADEYKKE